MTPSTKAELLPCPFCGSEAEVITDKPEPSEVKAGDTWVAYHVCCSNDDCQVGPGVYGDEKLELAAKAWNTRASEDTLLAERDALREALKFAVSVLNKQNLPGSVYAPVLQKARAALKEGE